MVDAHLRLQAAAAAAEEVAFRLLLANLHLLVVVVVVVVVVVLHCLHQVNNLVPLAAMVVAAVAPAPAPALRDLADQAVEEAPAETQSPRVVEVEACQVGVPVGIAVEGVRLAVLREALREGREVRLAARQGVLPDLEAPDLEILETLAAGRELDLDLDLDWGGVGLSLRLDVPGLREWIG